MPRLGSGLRRARQKSGLRQGELAARAGISRQTLSVLESGRGQPSTLIALNLARVLGCRVEELFWLDEESGAVRAETAGEAAGAGRALAGVVAGRWVAHPLRHDDPLAVVTAADALFRSPGEVVGKRFDFLVQEIFRELNTAGNKSAHAGVSALVVTAKTELEKVREQIQNIE